MVKVQSQCDISDQAVALHPLDRALLESFGCLSLRNISARSGRGASSLKEAVADTNAYLRDRDGVSSIGIGRHLLWQQLKTWRQADQLLPTPQREYHTLSQEDFSSHCEQTGGVSSPCSATACSAQQGRGFLQPESLPRKLHSRSMLSARCGVCSVRLRLHLSVDYSQRWPHLAISVRRRTDSGCDISPWTR